MERTNQKIFRRVQPKDFSKKTTSKRFASGAVCREIHMKKKSMIKKNLISAILITSLALATASGCGSKIAETGSGEDDQAQVTEADTSESTVPEETGTEKLSDIAVSNEGSGFSADFIAGSADSEDGSEEENVWDGGPDFDSIADEFYGIFHDMTIEDAANKYAINLVDGGKYADYEGDIGDVIPEYKDVDLDGDHKPDAILREGKHYVIEFSKGGRIETGDYSSSPNEGEIIEFEDMACRNAAEILIAHYTFGTGGPVVWDTNIYSNASGEWKAYPVIDDANVINSKELRDHIEEKTGKPYDPFSVRVASIDMTNLLIDYGHKEGPQQTHDYESAYLYMYFSPDYIGEYDDFTYSGYPDTMSLIYNWPLELSGEEVSITPDLQYEANIYLSNFSEQSYSKLADYPVSWAHFALEWAEVNDFSKVNMSNDSYRIDQSTMNGILGRFFGSNLEEGELSLLEEDNPFMGHVEYDDGKIWYCEPLADGEMYRNNKFSVVSKIEKAESNYNGNFTYLIMDFDVYSLDTDDYDEHGIGKEQYSLSADEAASLAEKDRLYKVEDGMAIVEETEDGYWLLYYKLW